MAYKFADYRHQRFGRLEARADDPKNSKVGTYWWFLCDCGNYVSKRVTNVLSGHVKSCGCLHRDYLNDRRNAGKLRKSLDIALDFMASPGMYGPSDNTVKTINETLYGKTGE